jgi:predicted RNA-binding protein with PIN domain
MAKTYLIDGHNLIGTGFFKGIDLEAEGDEAMLVDWLRARKTYLKGNVVVVFDHGIPGGTSRALSGGGVTVVFSSRKRTIADNVILNRVRNSKTPGSITVVTNDGPVRTAALRAGAKVLGAHAFISLIDNAAREQALARTRIQKEKPRLSRQEIDEFMQLFGGELAEGGE